MNLFLANFISGMSKNKSRNIIISLSQRMFFFNLGMYAPSFIKNEELIHNGVERKMQIVQGTLIWKCRYTGCFKSLFRFVFSNVSLFI